MKKRKLPPQLERNKFKPGVSGNPNGRPPLNPIQRVLRDLTIETYGRVIKAALTGNADALKAIVTDNKSSVVEVTVATSLLHSIKTGDPTVLERFAERIVGKIPEVIKIDSTNLNLNAKSAIDMVKIKAAIKKFDDGL